MSPCGRTNYELLMKNHEARPTGYAPFPKVNVTTHNRHERRPNRGRGNNHHRGRWYGVEKNNSRFQRRNYKNKGK